MKNHRLSARGHKLSRIANQHIHKCENRVDPVNSPRPFLKRGAYTKSDNVPARKQGLHGYARLPLHVFEKGGQRSVLMHVAMPLIALSIASMHYNIIKESK